MEPQHDTSPQPASNNAGAPQPPAGRRRTWLIVGAGIALLVVLGIGAFLLLRGDTSKTANNAPSEQPTPERTVENFIFEPADTAVSYAGNTVYDACNFVPYAAVRTTVPGIEKLFTTIGSDEQATLPPSIEHSYFDRDIAAALGTDGEEREAGKTPDNTAQTMTNFMSTFDSSCLYGQNRDLGLGRAPVFLKVQVIQSPTKRSPQLLNYVASLPKVSVQKGVEHLQEAAPDGGGFITAVLRQSETNVIVVIKSGTQQLLDAVLPNAIDTLSKKPRGPLQITYPSPWHTLPNPCSLLSAEQFTRFTGKPASALAKEELLLTEIDGGQMERSCQRLEIERLQGGPISKSVVAVRMARTASAAKAYVQHIKNNQSDSITIEPMAKELKGVDDAYIKVTGSRASRSYEAEMRIGATIVILELHDESGKDADASAFATRITPVMTHVANQLQ